MNRVQKEFKRGKFKIVGSSDKDREEECREKVAQVVKTSGCKMLPEITILGSNISADIRFMGKNATDCLNKVQVILDQFDCDLVPSVKLGGQDGIKPQLQFIAKSREPGQKEQSPTMH